MQFTIHETVLKNNPLDHNVNSNKKALKLTGIWKDAAKGDNGGVSKALKKGDPPNIQNEERRTPLHYAAEAGHFNVVETLLAAGGSTDIRDRNGDTPLHCALRMKNEDMAFFLVQRGASLDVTNAASLSGWDLAEKVSKRFWMKLKESQRCSNPGASSSSVEPVRKATTAPVTTNQRQSPPLNTVVVNFGHYALCLRAIPRPGAPQPEPRGAPYPATPHDALKAVHERLLQSVNDLVLITNKEGLPPNFKSGVTSLKDHVARQVELTKSPVTDTMILDSLLNDLGNLTGNLTDLVIFYEEAMVGQMFRAHLEKFTMSVKRVADSGYVPEITSDFMELCRNVMMQMLSISDPEKAKAISDGMMNLTRFTRALIACKLLNENPEQANAFVAAIVDSVRKIHAGLSQAGASSALFKEEEIEIFETAAQALEQLLNIPGLPVDSARVIQIFLSEISYMKEAANASPLDVDVLLNCALFVNCTCARFGKKFSSKKLPYG